MRDSFYDDVLAVLALDVASRNTNQAYNGVTVDKNVFNNQFKVVGFIIFSGAITDGTMTFTMEDSDNGSSWGAVSSSHIQGSLPSFVAADDNRVAEVSYLGPKRFVRIVGTLASATTGGILGAVAILGQPRRTPVARS